MSTYKGYLGELKNWLTMIEKKKLICERSEAETVLLTYDASEGLVLEFIGGHLMRDPRLT